MRHRPNSLVATDLHRASVARTLVFRRYTWHHCASVAAAQWPFYFCVLVITSHTHASRATSRSVTFPGYRVACLAVGTAQSSLVSLLCCSITAYRVVNSSPLLFWHFFDLSNSGVLSIFHSFSRRWYATIFRIEGTGATDKDDPRRYWQYYTSSIHYVFTP